MNVLFLTHRLPYAPDRGDRIRAYYELKTLVARHRVSLFSLVHDEQEDAHAEGLSREFSIPVSTCQVPSRLRAAPNVLASLVGDTPLTHVLLNSREAVPRLTQMVAERAPDVVFAFCSGMARFAVQAPLARFPFVLDMVDADSEKWRELGGSGSAMSWIYRREARCLARFEAIAIRQALATTVVNERERSALMRLVPDRAITIVPNGIDLTAFRRPETNPVERPAVVFTAVFSYEPNAAAAMWLMSEIWPRVRQQIPDATLLLVGADPPARLRRAALKDPSVQVTGRVPDVKPYLWQSAVSVAPLQIARGVQNKVLEGVAAGLLVVTTSAVMNGLPAEVLPACVQADTAAPFADAIVRLLRLDPNQRMSLSQRVDLKALSWDLRLKPLVDLLEGAAIALAE